MTVVSKTPEYKAWRSMQDRCYCEKWRDFHKYGGRGIRVFDAWRGPGGFQPFLAEVGPRPSAAHSLDRINTNGHYEPGNVRWATRVEQQRNRRNNVAFVVDGHTKTVAEIAENAGLSYHQVYDRVRGGVDPEHLGVPLHRKTEKKLDAAQFRVLVDEYRNGGITQQALADRHGVHRCTVRRYLKAAHTPT